MTMTRGWRLLGAMCAVGLALAGCGDRGPGGGGNERELSPLQQFMGWDDDYWVDDGEEFSEEDRQQHYQVQELIGDCMRDAGFEWHEEPFWGDQDGFRGGDDDPWQEAWELEQSDPEAYTKKYGYGITTIDYDQTPEPEEEWDPNDDPNWAYRETLSEAAQDAYEKALHGDWEAYEETREDEDEWDPVAIGGCWNDAWGEVHGWAGYGEEEDGWAQFEPLWEEFDALDQRIQDDPRMTEVVGQWSSCMADAGYPDLKTIWDGRDVVHDRQSELYGWDDFENEDISIEREAVREAIEEDEWEPVEPDPEDLAELRDFELAIAWADYECKQEHDVDAVEKDVRWAAEEQFIEDHREMLESYRDFMNEQLADKGGAGG